MTAVVLRPLGDATYAVYRRGVDTGAEVTSCWAGWVVHRAGFGDLFRVRFRRMSQAVEWLDSPDGQARLDSLAAEVPR